LAGVGVAQVDVAPGEPNFAPRDAVVFAEEEYARYAEHDARGAHGFGGRRRLLQRETHPLFGAKHAVAGGVGMNRGGTAAEQEAHRAKHAHDINRLPETVKDEDTLFKARGHYTR